MKKCLIIINPKSNGGKCAKFAPVLLDYLNANKVSYKHVFESDPKKIKALAYEGSKSFSRIVPVGGDGTLNSAMNGFFNSSGDLVSSALFCPVHAGTSPDFCKSYNIPVNPAKSMENILSNNIINIPIGKIILDNKTAFFMCAASVGIGSYIADNANNGIRKLMGDVPGTFVSIIKSLIQYKPASCKIKYNNKQFVINNITSLSIGITPYIASGLQVDKSYCTKDSFYLLLIRNLRITALPKVFSILYSGRKETVSDVLSIDKTDSIIIDGNNNIRIECDGDSIGELPCKIEMCSDLLPLVVQ
ncbi:MAG: hypothetical protein JXK07_08975 [Spirochaetes bacterium]|nr:hypothetical protein [Spirochaetota bacterium]MBN2770589.1 hypothetical protein [Spirochaetota bacterium]